RNFTQMSEKLDPEIVAHFLNTRYFSPMGEIAYKHGGTVDKHIGDSIMVVYGIPFSQEDDILRAVMSAMEMQERARELNASLGSLDGLRVDMGIGISTGRVFSGVLGSLRKKGPTCVMI
ncbi:adenylate/guanylate cyclase domain-containing protein, partial [Thermodesulfobacteriota bacterium]